MKITNGKACFLLLWRSSQDPWLRLLGWKDGWAQDDARQVVDRRNPELAYLGTNRSDKARRWAAGWATAGTAAWAGLAAVARRGMARIGVIELVFLFAPLVIVPLGMELGRVSRTALSPVSRRLGEWAQVLQPLGAALAVFAILLPPGELAGVAASGWLVVCALTAVGGIGDLAQTILRESRGGKADRGQPDDRDERPDVVRSSASLGIGMTRKAVGNLAAAVARIDLAVGAAWLVASRMGMRPIGIQEPIGLLTAVHFHFAGFAAAMIASCRAALDRTAEDGCLQKGRKWLRRVLLLVVGMPFLVAAGFVISPALKMGAGVIFAVSVAGLGWFMWNSAVGDATARRFLRVAAGCAFAGMMLAGTYAVADFAGRDVLTIPAMASTHGILNGFGFCLLGLLGWLVEGEQRFSPRGVPHGLGLVRVPSETPSPKLQ